MSAISHTEQVITGQVISSKMDKTITVRIEKVVPHPLYGKYIRRTSKLLAHDQHNECKEGDVVLVAACRPISGRKTWILRKVLRAS